METAASEGTNGANNEEHRTIPELVGQAIKDGTLTLDRGQYLFSGTDAASQVAGNLGIPFAPGDAWTIGRQASRDGTTDYYVLMYYSAEQRGDLSSYATGGSDWNWTVNDAGFYTTRKGSQIQVPVDYYIYDASTGAQNDGLRQTYLPEIPVQKERPIWYIHPVLRDMGLDERSSSDRLHNAGYQTEKTGGGTRNDEKPANKNQVLFIVRRNYRSSKFGRT